MTKSQYYIEFKLRDEVVENITVETDDLMYTLGQIGRNRSIKEFIKIVKNAE